jgi:hypothetical protein
MMTIDAMRRPARHVGGRSPFFADSPSGALAAVAPAPPPAPAPAPLRTFPDACLSFLKRL